MRDDRERFQDILEAISQIEKYAVRGQAKFQQHEFILYKLSAKPPVTYLIN